MPAFGSRSLRDDARKSPLCAGLPRKIATAIRPANSHPSIRPLGTTIEKSTIARPVVVCKPFRFARRFSFACCAFAEFIATGVVDVPACAHAWMNRFGWGVVHVAHTRARREQRWLISVACAARGGTAHSGRTVDAMWAHQSRHRRTNRISMSWIFCCCLVCYVKWLGFAYKKKASE